MSPSPLLAGYRAPLSVLLAGLTLSAAACSLTRSPEPEEPLVVEQPQEPEPEPATETGSQAVNDELAALQAAYRQLQADYRELEDRATKAELHVLERDARIVDLEQDLSVSQKSCGIIYPPLPSDTMVKNIFSIIIIPVVLAV